jgi:three-Cys-motif partner protein
MVKVKDKYVWSDDVNKAPLIESHSRIKHGIIKDYIRSYLKVVGSPPARKVKLIIVDGFCGGGLYRTDKGTPHLGSPIIALNMIRETVAEIVGQRLQNNILHEFSVECELYFIDKDKQAIETLQKVAAFHLILDGSLPLTLKANFICAEFSNVYKDILNKVGKAKTIFILDPCGYSETPLPVIREIMHDPQKKREVIWTFMIDAMRTFAHEDSQALKNAGYDSLLSLFSGDEPPSGFSVQKEIFDTVKRDINVPFFTPFAIKQKNGWNYWLIHLAWHYRASEVMKEVEHLHADEREHYGRSGLNMMAAQGDRIYLFGQDDLERGKIELQEDIPQLLSRADFKEGLSFNNFMEATYNETPLVSGIIKDVLINHEDIEVFTSAGGRRSSVKRIETSDIIRLKKQHRLLF